MGLMNSVSYEIVDKKGKVVFKCKLKATAESELWKLQTIYLEKLEIKKIVL